MPFRPRGGFSVVCVETIGDRLGTWARVNGALLSPGVPHLLRMTIWLQHIDNKRIDSIAHGRTK